MTDIKNIFLCIFCFFKNSACEKVFSPYTVRVFFNFIKFSMKVETKKLDGSKVQLIIEQDTKTVQKMRAKVIEDLRKNANIKGFRKGANIPEDIIVKNYGEEAIAQMTVERAIDGLYREALKSEKLLPVSQAEIQEILSQDPLKVQIEVEVFPEITIKDAYKKIKLGKEIQSVSDAEIDAALEDIKTRFTHFHDAADDGVAQMGDRATIDTQGYDLDGKVLEATNMQDYPLVLGSNLLVPGFEEQMVGMKQGETKDIDVNFPKDYHNAEFAGKKTKFTVTIKKLEKAHAPEFTPEFIENLRGKKLDMAGFKDLIKSEILETKEQNTQMQNEIRLIDELLKVTEMQIGEKLLAQQTDMVFQEIKQNVAQDGVRMEDYLASLGLSESEYKKKHVEATALKRLQGELILNKLAEIQKADIADSEVEKEIEKIMDRYQSPDVLARLRELYVPGNRYYEELKRRMILRNVIESFFQAKK